MPSTSTTVGALDVGAVGRTSQSGGPASVHVRVDGPGLRVWSVLTDEKLCHRCRPPVHVDGLDGLPEEGYGKLLLGRVTLGIFAVTGVAVALAEWNVLPREALLVGAPAIIPTLLLDTVLFNEFLIRTGDGFWILLSTFLYVQAVVVAGVAVLFSRMWALCRQATSTE